MPLLRLPSAPRWGRAPLLGLALLTLGAQSPPATLVVIPVGGWGEVEVDGEVLGLGPIEVQVEPGEHVVRLPETDYHPATVREVRLGAGERLEVTLPRRLKPAWLEPRGFPEGTIVAIDEGPGPLLQEGTRVAIDDNHPHAFTFRRDDEVLRRVYLRRCLEDGCLLPGQTRVEAW